MKTTQTLKALGGAAILILLVAVAYLLTKSEEQSLTAYQKYAQHKIQEERNGDPKTDAPELHGIIQRELRTRIGEESPNYGPNQVMEEFLKAKKSIQSARKYRTNSLDFVERGPGNVGGRTRALIVDPDDPNQETFYAGAASGGIWKTTNAGQVWEYISSDIPNLGVNTLVMAPSNTNVIYAGTGEHFTSDIDGSGMFKSTDRGLSWTQIADPSEMPDFKNVSRIVVDPNDENTVLATTRNTVWGGFRAAIYKTTDGGASWTRVRSSTSQRYDDIDYDPSDFNTLYVAVRALGVIKSTDGGATWTDASEGLVPSGRVEITVSPVNTNRIWASVEGGLSGNGSDLYVSNDGAQSWLLAVNSSGSNEDFLGGQGWYDNIITAHPFDEDIVYVGGVNTWKFELNGGQGTEIRSIQPEQGGTASFMSFINFGGAYLGGGMDVGTVSEEDLLPVEIRFGQGTQKAHRFTVGGQGPSVPKNDYVYEDYVEVPFQVWDTENNVQLMASFRDQQEDGNWNLIAPNTEGATQNHSREYLYIHNVPYSESADASISVTGGHETNQMYFFWPVLASGASFNAASLPESNLQVNFQITVGTTKVTTSVTDAYGQFDGPNGFPQATRSQGLHPDQHNIVMYDLNDNAKTFRMLVGNDGGVYRTVSSSNPGPVEGHYEFISYGYNTTQFYSADKAPGQNRYAGGMQDNGTWYHRAGVEGGAAVDATFGIGGDGFETLWHGTDPDRIIGGSQYNNFRRTVDGGSNWTGATSGFNDDGPFITRLAHHKNLPDRLFTVGTKGVWKSNNFGGNWATTAMENPELWSFSNSADVEVSYANPDVVWAGGALHSGARLFVSTNGGTNFAPCANYDLFNLGAVSGIGTHPVNDQVVYALFSFAGFPKVIKSEDLGQNWEDISGFDGTGAASDRGFPDVAVNCLFVFPNNTDRIWVGSEIGIIESMDGGASWSLLDSNMPPVNIYDFKQVDDQIVIATYGRGIWSVSVSGIVSAPLVTNGYTNISGQWLLETEYAASFDSVLVFLNDQLVLTDREVAAGKTTLTFAEQAVDGLKSTKVIGYLNGTPYETDEQDFYFVKLGEVADSYQTDFSSAAADFVSGGLVLTATDELEDAALHSDHPYADGVDHYAYLRTPIRVQLNRSDFSYEDIALVEPGAAGSAFGDDAFNDYVVVEGSSDGKNWIPLGTGYDASLHDDWTDAFQSGTVTSSLFKSHSVPLVNYFANGSTIMIRFRLHSNTSESGYGWVIDNLSIQTESILGTGKSQENLSIYPNPVVNEATLRFAGTVPSEVMVYDLNGKRMDVINTGGNREVVWDSNSLKRGVYLVKYSIDGVSQSQKVIVQ
ncbi:VPS10 domain-containing protein [Marinoscillum sp.]|uniref:VPS10 domain-containing protein n=1 Tax=Marinoscillum sp. TaxID=2024838 RepID=UPI003BACC60E